MPSAARADTSGMQPPEEHLSVLELLRRTCAETVEALDAAAALFSRVIGDLLLELAEHTQSGHALQLGHEYLVPDYPLTQEVIETCEPRIVSLLDEEPDPMEAALLAELGFDSLLMVPVPARGECWGLLEVYAAGGRRFNDDDARRAEKIVARTGRLISGARE
jgi:GAF domain-containing protein